MYLHHDKIAEHDLFSIDFSPESKYRICTTSPRYSGSDSDSSQEIVNINSAREPGKRLIQTPQKQVSESIKKEEKAYRADAVFYFGNQRAVTFYEAKSEQFTNVHQINKSLQQCICYALTELMGNFTNPCIMLLFWKDFISLVVLDPHGENFIYNIFNFEFSEDN